MENNTPISAKSYTLRTENGRWLGQVVLTTDGAFMAITDYGNFSYAWRSTGKEDFREFLNDINVEYFASKMYNGMSYVAYGKKIQEAANRFAKEILPALQKVLKEEIDSESQQ